MRTSLYVSSTIRRLRRPCGPRGVDFFFVTPTLTSSLNQTRSGPSWSSLGHTVLGDRVATKVAVWGQGSPDHPLPLWRKRFRCPPSAPDPDPSGRWGTGIPPCSGKESSPHAHVRGRSRSRPNGIIDLCENNGRKVPVGKQSKVRS